MLRADANAIASGRCEGRAGVYRKKLGGRRAGVMLDMISRFGG